MDSTMNPKRKETVNVELSDTIWHTGKATYISEYFAWLNSYFFFSLYHQQGFCVTKLYATTVLVKQCFIFYQMTIM